ncbi:MAG: FliG C-terminal domain-containing protein, partial [Candidatus Latescibacterota bacterium]
MLDQQLYLDAESDGTILAGWDGEGRGEAFTRLCVIVLAKADDPGIGGAFLYALPLHMQAAILLELLTRSSLTCMRGLEGKEAELIAWMRQQLGTNERWGGQWVAEIMRSGSGRAMQVLLEALDGLDRPSTLILQQHLFQFTDLFALSARDFQLVLSSESNEQIALALQGISEGQVDQVLEHVSPRRRRLIIEEAERYVDASSDEIVVACQAIITTARLLQRRHRITSFIPGLSKTPQSGVDPPTENQGGAEAESNAPNESSENRERKSLSRSKSSISFRWVGLGMVVGLSVVWFLITGDFTTGDS